jgi:hypothetical protein
MQLSSADAHHTTPDTERTATILEDMKREAKTKTEQTKEFSAISEEDGHTVWSVMLWVCHAPGVLLRRRIQPQSNSS